MSVSEEGASDLGAILYISKLLAQRKGVSNWGVAWEQLQTQYLPCTDGRSLYALEKKEEHPQVTKGKNSKSSRLSSIQRKIMTLTLAVVVSLLGGMLATQAAGTNVLEVIATWTDETFHLVTADHGEDGADETPQLEELLPAWQLDGFVPGEPEWISWTEAYSKGDLYYGFIVDKRAIPSSKYYEKDDGPVEEYIYHGITHYIFTNLNSEIVVWMVEDVEYSICATKGAFDLKALIRSAYEEG